jgi:tetratricopeptide (TPR) repeat protein
MPGLWSIGQVIRVEEKSNKFSAKAIVSFVHDDGTLDVIYQGEGLKEECAVQLGRVRALEDFEFPDSVVASTASAEQLKNNGNMLFSLKDYHSAIEIYRRSIIALYKQSGSEHVSTGSVVLVSKTGSINFECAMISDTNSNKTFEIVYDNSNIDDEEKIERNRLTPICISASEKSLHRSLYMNMAKCNLKINQTGWAIRHCSLAIAVSRILFSDADAVNAEPSSSAMHKQLADSIFLRAKALLQANRPGLAAKVCSQQDLFC